MSVLRKLLSPAALAIAGLLVLFDYIAHQSPIPFAVVEEPLPYYLLKFVAFYAAALVVIYAFRSPLGSPVYIGIGGAAFVALAYYFVTFVPLGQRTIGGQALWFLLHYALGALAAGIVLRRPVSIIYAAIVLMAVVGFGFLFAEPLAATPPAVGPGY